MGQLEVLVLGLVTISQARPDIGYNYRQPQYVPQSSRGFQSNHPQFNPELVNSQLSLPLEQPQASFNPVGQQASFNLGPHGQAFNFARQPQASFNFGPQQTSFNPAPQSFNPSSQPQFNPQFPDYPTITKDIYVHLAPEDPAPVPRPLPQPLPPRKHYRIIFIKAPQPAPQAQVVVSPAQQQQQVEEKTLVYVLVEKQKQPEIIIPTPAPTQPSKPEVYFIKYKKSDGGGGGGDGGDGLPVVEDLKRNQGENSGESSSSLFSGGRPLGGALAPKYGPPGYQKRSN